MTNMSGGEEEIKKTTNVESYIGGIEVALTTLRTFRERYSRLTHEHDWPIFKALGELESALFDIYLDKQRTVNDYDGKLHTLKLRSAEKSTYIENYESTFKDIVENEDGTINKDQMMRELSDYVRFMETASIVYCEVTGGMVSKINTLAECIIGAYNDHLETLYEQWEEDYKESYECGCSGP